MWADASQSNRPNGSSTVGYIASHAPKSILDGSEEHVALVGWKSSEAPKQCLGSNGSEVQAITDVVSLYRALWYEIHGAIIERGSLYEDIKEATHAGRMMMDSRGMYDAMVRNEKSLLAAWPQVKQSWL